MNRIEKELDFAVGRIFTTVDMNHISIRQLASLGYFMIDIKCNMEFHFNVRSLNNYISISRRL